MQNLDPVVIVGSARTPLGDMLGVFSKLQATNLGAIAIKAAIERATLDVKNIDEVIMGCVLSAGLGQAPARQAAIMASIPTSVPCTTVNKVCGSAMKAVMLAHDLLLAGTNKIMIAGGMESMTNAPYLLEKARGGYRLGHGQIIDEMLRDGLEDAYDKGVSMGIFAERTAEKYCFSRQNQDEFAMTSLQRAQAATKNGWFLSEYEITPVTITLKKDESILIKEDEHQGKVNITKIPTLKPTFKPDGTITAANSSSIADGAAALVLMRMSEAKKQGLKPLAKILHHTSFAHEPAWFTTAPTGAIKKLLNNLNLTADTVELYEINEAFACVAMATMRDLNISHDKVNILGGACALGHPIGASGARVICTLLSALQQQNKTLGIASVCIGGGEATAIAIERL